MQTEIEKLRQEHEQQKVASAESMERVRELIARAAWAKQERALLAVREIQEQRAERAGALADHEPLDDSMHGAGVCSRGNRRLRSVDDAGGGSDGGGPGDSRGRLQAICQDASNHKTAAGHGGTARPS